MTAKEAKKLKVGERVLWLQRDVEPVRGVVIEKIVHGVGIDWADGERGYLAFDDTQAVERETEANRL